MYAFRSEGASGWRGGGLALCFLALYLCSAETLEAQGSGPRVHGAQVRLEPRTGGQIRGELLASAGGRVVVRTRDGAALTVPVSDLYRVVVQRDRWTGASALRWAGVAGGVTTLGMFVACARYEGSAAGDCFGLAAGWALAWGLIGLGGVVLVEARPSWIELPEEELPRYARFPQGLPAELRPDGASR